MTDDYAVKLAKKHADLCVGDNLEPLGILSRALLASKAARKLSEDTRIAERGLNDILVGQLREIAEQAEARCEALLNVKVWANDLLGLYDWRNVIGKREKNKTISADELSKVLRWYGQRKKKAWEELRAALAAAKETPT